MTESVIDFPKDGLCPDIWEKGLDINGVNEVWKLKPEVINKINSIHQLVCPEAKKIHITGSITSNSYTENADIDVHFLNVGINFKNEKEIEKYQNQLRDKYKPISINKHPFEIYYQPNEFQDYMSVGCYDFFNQKWLVGPEFKDKSFNPYSAYYKEATEKSESYAKKIRNMIFSIYEIAVVLKKNVGTEMQSQLTEILISRLNGVKKLYDELRNIRKVYSSPKSKEEALRYRNSKKWHIADATFKLFDKYGYLAILKEFIQLNDILKNSQDISEEVSSQILNIVKNYINNADKLSEKEIYEDVREDNASSSIYVIGVKTAAEYLKNAKSDDPSLDRSIFKKAIDYPSSDSVFYAIDTNNNEVGALAVVRKDGPGMYLHELVGFRKGYGKEILKQLCDKYKKLWLQCGLLGNGENVPYTPNEKLRDKFYRKCQFLKEYIVKDSVWDCNASFFYTQAISDVVISTYLEKHYGKNATNESQQLDEGAKEAVSSFALALALLIPGIASAKTAQSAKQVFKANMAEVQKKQNEFISLLNGKDPHQMMNGYEMWQALNILALTLFGEGRGEIKAGGLDPITDSILNRTANTPDINRVANICVGKKEGKAFQYSFWNKNKNALAVIKNGEPVLPKEIKLNMLERIAWEACLKRAVDIMTGNYKVQDPNINSYHVKDMPNPPTWSNKMKHVKYVGSHKFGYVQSNDPTYMDMATMTPISKPSAGRREIASYTVKRGDSLWKIARDNNTTAKALAAKNGISINAILKPGQKLKV